MIHCTHRTVERYESPRPAVFLDRDGTLTEYRGFITSPAKIQLVKGACDAIRSLRSAGFAIVLVTNQSAIGRKMIDHDQLEAIHSELTAQLAKGNAQLAAIYYCPEAPIGTDETVIESPDRKPGPGMLLAAAKDLNLDLPNSWMIGDRISDILAGTNADCRASILLRSDRYPENVNPEAASYEICNSLPDAAAIILQCNST